jgi:hypothetical protein
MPRSGGRFCSVEHKELRQSKEQPGAMTVPRPQQGPFARLTRSGRTPIRRVLWETHSQGENYAGA